MSDVPTSVVGSWAHAHEQDGEDGQVFVPAGTPLPPSRGRQVLTLAADGGASRRAPGPDDRHITREGYWLFSGDTLSVYFADAGALIYDVISVRPDRLVLRLSPRV